MVSALGLLSLPSKICLSFMAEQEPASKRSPMASLRLVQFEKDGVTRVGAELGVGGDIVDLIAIDSSIPSTTVGFLQAGDAAMAAASA